MKLFEDITKIVTEDEEIKELNAKIAEEKDPVKRDMLEWEAHMKATNMALKARHLKQLTRDEDIISEMKRTGASYEEISKFADSGLLNKQRSARINADLESKIMSGSSPEGAIVDVLKENGILLDTRMIEKVFQKKKKQDNEDFMKVIRS